MRIHPRGFSAMVFQNLTPVSQCTNRPVVRVPRGRELIFYHHYNRQLDADSDSASRVASPSSPAETPQENALMCYPLWLAAGGVAIALVGFLLGVHVARRMLVPSIQADSDSLAFYEMEDVKTNLTENEERTPPHEEGMASSDTCYTPCVTPPPRRASRLSPIFKGWTNADNQVVVVRK